MYNRTTEKYIVAYIDLLGVTAKIKDTEQEKISMNKLHNLYTFSIDLTRQIAIAGNKDIVFKIFSDNIIIAKKITEVTIKDDIYCLLSCVGHFQELAASDSVGWLLRGGITIGNLFIDDVMVWGNALLRAYELEDKVSIYPRVIIDKNVIELISPEDKSYAFIRYDYDGFAFLNFLNNCHFVGERLMRGFELMKADAGAAPNDRVLQKLIWHKNFVNNELDFKNEKGEKNIDYTIKTWEVKLMKAVIYARYSSDNQREESIEGQLRENKAFAEKNGIEIIGTYIDRALSAKTDNRPEFQKMIKDSSKGLFDIVIVWKLDRFARNRYDSAFYKATLKKNNVKVMSATENISEGADGILLEAILEGFAEYYSVELAEKIKRGMTENALKLRSNGVRAPIGYYIDDEKHFQIDENNAPIIKDIFTLYNDGTKVSEIVKLMKSRGIKNRGNFMNYNAIFRILTNRKYIGEYKFGDILVPNAFPAIIDEGLFNAVQDRMKRNKKAPAMHRSEDDYLLTTHLFCGKCGSMMTGEIGTSHTAAKYRYYKCNQAKKKKCDKKTVRKEWLENLVIDTILELITDDSVIEELAERVYRFQNLESAESILLKAQLEEVQKKLNNLAEAMAQGIFSATTKKLLDDLEEQKKSIETDIIQYQIRNPIIPKEQLLFALYNYRKLDMSVQSDRQKLIDSFVNSIYLYDDHFIITFNYKNTSKKVSLKEVNSSSLTSSSPPKNNRHSDTIE